MDRNSGIGRKLRASSDILPFLLCFCLLAPLFPLNASLHSLTGGGLLVETQTVSSRQGQSGDVSQNLYYAYSDRLGSVRSITDGDGRVMERRHYDAWGRPEGLLRIDITPRGFTGHEHIGAFGLIDMNGRMYDPVTAQFLSPDPYIQSPGSWLNYNRYAYCLHNPLMYTDPDGEYWHIIIGAVVGGQLILSQGRGHFSKSGIFVIFAPYIKSEILQTQQWLKNSPNIHSSI